MINQVRTRTFPKHSDTDPSLGKLRQVCADFESLLLATMLKSMSSALSEVGFLGKTHESRLIRSMMDENLALKMAQEGGTGLGEVLFEKLKNSKNLVNSFRRTTDK